MIDTNKTIKLWRSRTVKREYQCMVCMITFPEKCDHMCEPYCVYPSQEPVLRPSNQVAWRLIEFTSFSDDPLDCCLHWRDNETDHKYELVNVR